MSTVQYVLPDMPYDYAALAPAITGEILQLHHSKHVRVQPVRARAAHDLLGARMAAAVRTTHLDTWTSTDA
jgi:superoxide dismutase